MHKLLDMTDFHWYETKLLMTYESMFEMEEWTSKTTWS